MTSCQLQNGIYLSQATPLPDSETANVKNSTYHPVQGKHKVLDVHASNTYHEYLSFHQENLQKVMDVKTLLSTNERFSMHHGETRSENEEDVKRLVSLHTLMGLGIHSKFILSIYIYIYIYDLLTVYIIFLLVMLPFVYFSLSYPSFNKVY